VFYLDLSGFVTLVIVVS